MPQGNPISMKKRQKLVEMVFENKLSISEAGRRLGVKISTAKLIIKRYRETGTFATRRVPGSIEREPEGVPQNLNSIPSIPENVMPAEVDIQREENAVEEWRSNICWFWINGYIPMMSYIRF